MSPSAPIYCLDANVIIQAWQKYYSPEICPDYWEILNQLGSQGRIFIPEEVRNEIVVPDNKEKTDDLSKWLKRSSIPVQKPTEQVIRCWQNILQANPLHKLLVDNVKGRSLADPWVISHAFAKNATVVTKESPITSLNAKRPVTIPNVCDNMGIRWIDDFTFVKEIGLKFSCRL